MKPLAFRQVSLTHFKNYADARFTFGEKFNLISGLNGVGKTNLLDAVYYLCVGKSYFTPYDQRVVEQGADFFRLEAEVTKNQELFKLLIKVKPGSVKELMVNGVVTERISAHLGFIPIVFSAPRDIDLVIGPGQTRRRYFDHLLCQIDPAYLSALMHYNYLLQMRTAALKNGFDDLRRIVQTYDGQMASPAAIIHAKRDWLRGVLQPLLHQAYKTLSDNREEIGFAYESQLHEYAYEVLTDRFWDTDKNTARSNAGIHKDDYSLSVKGMSAKEFGSQGQIKSLIFSMHLAKYAILREQSGYNPVLILDDIFDKLDERRLARLMEILSTDDFGQIFISDTSRERMLKGLPVKDIVEIKLTPDI